MHRILFILSIVAVLLSTFSIVLTLRQAWTTDAPRAQAPARFNPFEQNAGEQRQREQELFWLRQKVNCLADKGSRDLGVCR